MKYGKIKPLVKQVLMESKGARDDDFVLVYEVIAKLCGDSPLTLAEVAQNHVLLGLPSYAGITRARRRILQEMKASNPELSGSEQTQLARGVEREQYQREFGRDRK